MKIGKTLYVSNRRDWRSWLVRNHASAKEIWLVYYKKGSSKPRIPYDHAVEEALCYGWIDSIVKAIDKEKYAQRFSPRRKGSPLSELNRERVHRLIAGKKMTSAGLRAIGHAFDASSPKKPLRIPRDIRKRLKKDKTTWKNFSAFPESYKRIRIFWIDAARSRPDIFRSRLGYFLKMTAKNRKFGMIQA